MSTSKHLPDDQIEPYFKHLAAEYHALPGALHAPYKEEIEKILALGGEKVGAEVPKRPGKHLTWDDLFQLELLLLRVLPEDKLLRKAWLIRNRYGNAIGAAGYALYVETQPPAMDPNTKTPDLDCLRADLEVVLQDLFWRYKLSKTWEEKRKDLLGKFTLGYILLVACGIAAVGFWGQIKDYHSVLILLAVAVAGATGGIVSMLQRLQTVPQEQKRTDSVIQLQYGSTGLLLQSVLTGGIFATLLLLFFAGGILTGELFPQVEGARNLFEWLKLIPDQGRHLAKLLLWAFVAGFAERLVPDFLDRLAVRGQKRSEAAPTTT